MRSLKLNIIYHHQVLIAVACIAVGALAAEQVESSKSDLETAEVAHGLYGGGKRA